MEPFIGEIQIFPYTFPPLGWAYCDGQILPIQQYMQLYAIIGTIYGGDGVSSTGLPNLKGRAPMHWGLVPPLGYNIGTASGEASIALTTNQIPMHTHTMQADATTADQSAPATTEVLAQGYTAGGRGGGGKDEPLYTAASAANAAMNPNAVGIAGGSLGHENMQPYLALNFCIALTGIFPSRN